jgi:hypothetical protein
MKSGDGKTFLPFRIELDGNPGCHRMPKLLDEVRRKGNDNPGCHRMPKLLDEVRRKEDQIR